MIKRTIEISTNGQYLCVKHGQLVIKRDGEAIASIPCEDIGLVIGDAKGTIYSHDALVRAAMHGAVTVLCGDDHHPVAMVLPIAANETQTQRVRAQASAKKTLLKRLWQQIVKVKIARQASLIPETNPARKALLCMAKRVRSGDAENLEGQAARKYWRALFGDPAFRRARFGQSPNNLLNYGYMALRAATARAVCGAGLHPSLGIAHHNKYNPFCLADDLMEPFRPNVDAIVRRLHDEGITEIDRNSKAVLLRVLTGRVTLGSTSGPLMVALHTTAASFVKCLMGDADKLALPEI